MPLRPGLIAVLAIVGTAACGASAAPGAGSPTSNEPTRTPATTAVSPTATPDPQPRHPISIAFAGDIHFESQLRSRLDDPATALAPVAPQLSSADLTVVNLETSIGTGGTREPKRFTFQAPPQAFDALAAAGVDVVTMANNHGVDFGAGGLADTLAAIPEAPLSVVGIGADEDAAFAPALHEVGGTTIAVIGASSADDPTADPTAQWAAGDGTPGIAVATPPARLVDEVRAASGTADVVVVFMHWGVQGDRCPSASQAATARALSDAGADVVVGSHAHVVQGTGMLGDTYVAYGLGNFVWYTSGSEAASTTGVLTLTVDGGRVVDETWAPARIQADGLPRFSTGAEADAALAAFAGQRACTDLAAL
jgi:poly-gamma-glutamate capsule biosynthesis protein CapA/YwtB (metallophosphatase superfamily)